MFYWIIFQIGIKLRHKKIQFKLPDNAKSVSEHLYNVQLEGNCLVFSEFDKKAFKLALVLEGLDKSALVQNVHQLTQALDEYGAAIRQPVRFYDPPKYVVKIKLVQSLPSLALSAISSPCIFVNSKNSKELLVDLAIDEVFRMFLSLLLIEVDNGISITLSGKMDRVVFMAKNIGTKDVQHF